MRAMRAGTARRRWVSPGVWLACGLALFVGCNGNGETEEARSVRQSFETTCGNTAYAYDAETSGRVRVTVKNNSSSGCSVTLTLTSGGAAKGTLMIGAGTAGTLERSGVDGMTIVCDGGPAGDCKGSFTAELL